MPQANPYTLAALAGLCAGEKHSLLNQQGIDAIAKNAAAIGKAAAAADGFEADDFPHQDTQPAGATGQQQAQPQG